jgi:hypothetical protein
MSGVFPTDEQGVNANLLTDILVHLAAFPVPA